MKSLLHQSRLAYLVQQRNGYLVLAILSLALNTILVLALIKAFYQEKIILLPPEITRSFWIAGNQVSPGYLTEISLFLAHLRFDLTPGNAALQKEILLRYVHPKYYSALKTELGLESDRLTKEQIATAFYPVQVKVDNKKMTATIIGDLQTMVGDAALPPKRLTYQLSFHYGTGKLLLQSFMEVQSNG